jgi:hypothetical protein
MLIWCLAPYLATAAADANCFLYLFVKPHDITTVYAYPECVLYTDHGCLKFAPSTPVVSAYTPPFIYYYQCSTSVITNYVPVFILVYMCLGLFMPAWHFFNLYLAVKRAENEIDGNLTANEWETALKRAKLKTYAAFIGSKKGTGLFKAPNTTCNLIGHLAVLLTFGVVYPPLGVIIALYMVTTTLTWQSLLESLFSVCDFSAAGAEPGAVEADRVSGQPEELPVLNESSIVCYNLELQCFGLYNVLHDSKELLFACAGLFYASLLLDMIGDQTVHEEVLHLWVPLSMMLVAVFISKNKEKLANQLGLNTVYAHCVALFSRRQSEKHDPIVRSSTLEMSDITGRE